MLKYFISVVCIFLSGCAFAFIEQDTVVTRKKDRKIQFLGFRAGIELISPIQSFFAVSTKEVSFQGEVCLKYLFLVYDVSYSQTSLYKEKTFEYNNNGVSMRFGVDINFTHKNKNRDAIFWGLRYCFSHHDESLSLWNTYWEKYYLYRNENQLSTWYEMVFGIKAKIASHFYMGYTVRIKFNPTTDNQTSFNTYHIPSFGTLNTFSDFRFGFDYHLYYFFSK
ncbi:MAG: DUF6048 family protein [Chitinophagaceae bacterium]|nr:DUF6048 family protein [Chitinophagaceae bacterium]